MPEFVKMNDMWWYVDQKTQREKARLCSILNEVKTNVDITNLEIKKTRCFENLDWTDTNIYNNSYKTGWLSPSGKFFGCEFFCHSTQAEMVHRKSEVALEKEGFVRISYNEKQLVAFFMGNYYNKKLLPTDKQMKYLEEHKKEIDYRIVESAFLISKEELCA